jgi:hypothetical protein
MTSASTVGFPLESKISLALISWMVENYLVAEVLAALKMCLEVVDNI